LLDGIHIDEDYNGKLLLKDVGFFPRCSTLLGGEQAFPPTPPTIADKLSNPFPPTSLAAQSWAWTVLGKLNIIMGYPDLRKSKSEDAVKVFDLMNRMVGQVASGEV